MNPIVEIAKLKERICDLEKREDTNFAIKDLVANANRLHNWNNKNLSISKINNLTLEAEGSGNTVIRHIGATGAARDVAVIINAIGGELKYRNPGNNKISSIKVLDGAVVDFFSTDNIFKFNLNNLPDQDELVGFVSSSKRIGSIKIDNTLRLLNGVLSVVGGGGGNYTDAQARQAISLTTNGTSGAAEYNNITGVLNIPNYQFTGDTKLKVLSITSNFAPTESKLFLKVTPSTGPIEITIDPSILFSNSPARTEEIVIIKAVNNVHDVIVKGTVGVLIDNSPTFEISLFNQSISVRTDGVNLFTK